MRKVLLLICILFITIAANFQVVRNIFIAPKDTFYTGAMGFFLDYYQFLSWIRDGGNGQLLLSSRYIPDRESGVLLHPLFPLLGLFGEAIKVPNYLIYHIARNVFLLTWIGSIGLLCISFSRKKNIRLALFVLILLGSGFPSPTLSSIIPFWDTFYTLEKFIIPPHHTLANTLFLVIIIFLASKLSFERRPGFFETLFLSLCSVLLFLVNPASASFLLAIFVLLFLINFIHTLMYTTGDPSEGFPAPAQTVTLSSREMGNARGRTRIFIFFFSILPFAIYNFVIFKTTIPWKYYYEGEAIGRYMVSFVEYLLSLGPLFFVSLLSLLYVRKFRLLEKICSVWLILPIFLFPFVGRQIPFSMSRLFSLNLFIPASILSIFFLVHCRFYVRRCIIIFLSVSLALGFSNSLKNVFFSQPPLFYNIFLPKELVTSIDFLKKNTTNVDTVIAGQHISSIIPAFTDARVVLGRFDAYPDYERVKSEVDDIYFRRIVDNQMLIRLKTWHVKYILFGLDHVDYEAFVSKGKVGGIDEVFQSGNIVIAEVKL